MKNGKKQMGNKIELINHAPSSLEIHIQCKRISKIAFISLVFFIILSIGGLAMAIISSEDGKIFIVPLLIYIASAIYLSRLLLWNSRGKEVYKLSKGQISYYYDYGLFKDNENTKKFNLLTFGVLDKNNNDVYFSFDKINNKIKEGYLLISLDEEDVESTLPIEISSLVQVIKKVDMKIKDFIL